jgi:hypothetical protein
VGRLDLVNPDRKDLMVIAVAAGAADVSRKDVFADRISVRVL